MGGCTAEFPAKVLFFYRNPYICRKNSDELEKKEHTPTPEADEPVELPFAPSSGGWVEWIYDHRRGLLAAAGVYLLLFAVVATARISLERSTALEVYVVDPAELERLAEERDRLEEQVRALQDAQALEREYNERIQNAASNAEGELNADLRDAQGTQASDIYDEAQAVQDRMNASRDAYERGLREAQSILDGRPQSSSTGAGQSGEQGRAKGRVTVEYRFPSSRSHRAGRLPVPAYRCPGGGTVVVDVEADAGGRIVKTSVARDADPCLAQYAEQSARASLFASGSGESGTITYEFIAQ